MRVAKFWKWSAVLFMAVLLALISATQGCSCEREKTRVVYAGAPNGNGGTSNTGNSGSGGANGTTDSGSGGDPNGSGGTPPGNDSGGLSSSHRRQSVK